MKVNRSMELLQRTISCLFCTFLAVTRSTGAFVGVNYGTNGDNLPTPQQVVDFLQKQRITQVRVFDVNAGILQAFSGSNIQIIVGIPNEDILRVGRSNATAVNWVKKNIAAYLPNTNITGIAVGRQVLTDFTAVATVLVPTMKYIQAALVAANLDNQVKVSTPHSTSLLQDSFPPSQATFNQTFAKTVIQPLLRFLSDTGSYFMLNIYPQSIYTKNQQIMSIDYALFRPNSGQLDSNTNLLYRNLFDSVIDAAYNAMGALNITNLPIVISETGWPSRGDLSEVGISIDNAATYAGNLVNHILNNTGTPRRPGVSINTYIYELFNEDGEQGATSVKNYGIFYPDQTPVYSLDTTGAGLNANASSNRPSWCIAKQGVSSNSLQAALDYACGEGRADCSQVQAGGKCYFPNTLYDHASYAFNSYYQKSMMATGTCDFAGVATVTTTDPSHGQCIFPTSFNTSTSTNGTITNGSTNGTNNASGASGVGHNFGESILVAMLLVFLRP